MSCIVVNLYEFQSCGFEVTLVPFGLFNVLLAMLQHESAWRESFFHLQGVNERKVTFLNSSSWFSSSHPYSFSQLENLMKAQNYFLEPQLCGFC